MNAVARPAARSLAVGDIVTTWGVADGAPTSHAIVGTLGAFARVNGTRSPDLVLVSSWHVLRARGAGPGAGIQRPSFTSSHGALVARADSLAPVAIIVDGGGELHHRFGYGDAPPDDYFVDCAMARVAGAGGWLDDGTPTSPAAVRIRGLARLHPLDAVGGRAPRVRIVRARGDAAGTVLGADVSVTSGGARRQHNIAIRSAIERGDSGAVVLDERGRAVGLVWGRDDHDPTIAYACHIHPVLDLLGVTLLTRPS